jgi:hypothetical protein
LVVVALLFVSGGKNLNSPTPAPLREDQRRPNISEPGIVPQPSETAVSLTVNSVTTSSELSKYSFDVTPTPGNKIVVVDLTLTNLNKHGLYMGNASYFKLTTSDGMAYSYSSSTHLLPHPIGAGVFHTNPGEKVKGQIAFEIPQSVEPTALTYGDGLNGVAAASWSNDT